MRENETEDRGTYLVSGRPEAAVLFLLHGRRGTRHDWVRLGQVYRQLEMSDLGLEGAQRLLVVMPEGHLSEEEREDGRFPDTGAFTQRLQGIVNDVRAMIAPDRALFWAIAGVSMGARQALEYVQAVPGLQDPAIFGTVGCFSPALSNEWMERNAAQLAAARELPEYYIAWGSRDYDEIQRNGLEFSRVLRQAGTVVSPNDQEREGDHRWDSRPELWQSCLREFIDVAVAPRFIGPG
jgi:pimeloyl-ACP methyl ester carboxylesterase